MSWHFVERWLQKVNQHSTLIGKFWVTFLIVFRIVVVSSVGDRVYSDEQSEFKCNTMQVGCSNVCFNKFSPISHIRFWSFQIIMVTTPSIVFMVYSAHQTKKKPATKDKTSISGPVASPTKKSETALKEGLLEDDKKKWKKTQMFRPSSFEGVQGNEPRKTVIQEMFGEDKAAFSQHYILYGLSVVMRTGVEIVFVYLQHHQFGFIVPELYKCEADPCPNIVDCFVSRPMEKTIFLCFMFTIGVIGFLLNVVELLYLCWQFCVRRPRLERARRKALKQTMTSESQHFNLGDAEILDGGTISGGQIANAPPAYRCRMDLYDVDTIDMSQIPPNLPIQSRPIAMSFSMDDAILPENVVPTSKYLGYQVNAPSVSSNSNNFAGPVANEPAINEQPYLANPRAENTKQKGYYDYV